jgi:hypothetical protein
MRNTIDIFRVKQKLQSYRVDLISPKTAVQQAKPPAPPAATANRNNSSTTITPKQSLATGHSHSK